MGEVTPSRYMVTATWDDAPHVDERAKQELLDATPPYLRDARTKGIPSLGAGAVYPIPESEILVDPFEIPAFWKRAYGMDVGWNRTAAIWVARDHESDTMYATTEYYRGQAVPAVHATAIKARGEWIKGAIDPASRNRSQGEGKQLLVDYLAQGLRLVPAVNAVEPGLLRVWQMLETGRLKLFSTLQNTLAEYRLYRRDENGKIVKKDDHLLDALRYIVMTFDQIARVRPVEMAEGTPYTGPADAIAGY